jgi:hypothetical protein
MRHGIHPQSASTTNVVDSRRGPRKPYFLSIHKARSEGQDTLHGALRITAARPVRGTPHRRFSVLGPPCGAREGDTVTSCWSATCGWKGPVCQRQEASSLNGDQYRHDGQRRSSSRPRTSRSELRAHRAHRQHRGVRYPADRGPHRQLRCRHADPYSRSQAHPYIEDNQGATVPVDQRMTSVQVSAKGDVYRGRKDANTCAGTVTVDMLQDAVALSPDLAPQDPPRNGGTTGKVPASEPTM